MADNFDGILKLKDIFNKTCKLDYKHHVLKLTSLMFEQKKTRGNATRTNMIYNSSWDFEKYPPPFSMESEGFLGQEAFTFDIGESPGPTERSSSSDILGEDESPCLLMFGNKYVYSFPNFDKVKYVPNIFASLLDWSDYENYVNYDLIKLGVYQGVGYAVTGTRNTLSKSIVAKKFDYNTDEVTSETITVSDINFEHCESTVTQSRYIITQQPQTTANRICYSSLPTEEINGIKYFEIRESHPYLFGSFAYQLDFSEIYFTFHDIPGVNMYPEEWYMTGNVLFKIKDGWCHYDPYNPVEFAGTTFSVPLGIYPDAYMFVAQINVGGNGSEVSDYINDISPGTNVYIEKDPILPFSPSVGDIVTISSIEGESLITRSEDVLVSSIVSGGFYADRIIYSHTHGGSLSRTIFDVGNSPGTILPGNNVYIPTNETTGITAGNSIKIWSRNSIDEDITTENANVTKVIAGTGIIVDSLSYEHVNAYLGVYVQSVSVTFDYRQYDASIDGTPYSLLQENEYLIQNIVFSLQEDQQWAIDLGGYWWASADPGEGSVFEGYVWPDVDIEAITSGVHGPLGLNLEVIAHYWDDSIKISSFNTIWSKYSWEDSQSKWNPRGAFSIVGYSSKYFSLYPDFEDGFEIFLSVNFGFADGYVNFFEKNNLPYVTHDYFRTDAILSYSPFGDNWNKIMAVAGEDFSVSGGSYPFNDRIPFDYSGWWSYFYNYDYMQVSNNEMKVTYSNHDLPNGKIGLAIFNDKYELLWDEQIDIPFSLTSNDYFYTYDNSYNYYRSIWDTDFENWACITDNNIFYFCYEISEPANERVGVLGIDLNTKACYYWYDVPLSKVLLGYERIFSEDLLAGSDVVIKIPDTTNYSVNCMIKVWDGTDEDPLGEYCWVTSVNTNVSVTVKSLLYNHSAGGTIDRYSASYQPVQKLWHYGNKMAFCIGKDVYGSPPTSKPIWRIIS